jgi:hypothetical protein
MPRVNRSVALRLGSALALSACGGSADAPDPAPDPAPETSASPGETSSSTESATTSPAADRIADPCALLDPPDYTALVEPKALPAFGEQITQRGAFMTCVGSFQTTESTLFGFALDPSAYDAAYDEQAPRGGYDDSRDELEIPLADRAFVSTREDVGVEVYAEADGVTFFVAHPLGGFGASQLATGTPQDVVAAATTAVARGAGRISDTAVLVPESCPSVDDPVTTDLVGTVAWGRGGSNPAGIAACGYAGDGDAQVEASYTFLLDSVFDREYGSEGGPGDVVVDPRPGVVEKWYQTSTDAYRYVALYPDYEPPLMLAVDARGIPGSKEAAGPRFTAWAQAYLAANAPQDQPE